MVTRLLPHIRQFVGVRQALVRAEARHTTVTALLDNPRIGVVHLDRRWRILAANDRALSLLRQGEWLSDKEGVLQARAPDDQYRLARLVAEALPPSGAVPVSGSMRLGRVSGLPPFVVHIKPVGVPQPDYGARHVAALVLIVEPGRHPRLDPDVVARTLGLTLAESQVAAWLADGENVRARALTVSATSPALRAQIATSAPSAARCSATARPMPLVPPVTRAFSPLKPRSMMLLLFGRYGASQDFRMPAPTVYFGSTKLPRRTRPHWLSIM